MKRNIKYIYALLFLSIFIVTNSYSQCTVSLSEGSVPFYNYADDDLPDMYFDNSHLASEEKILDYTPSNACSSSFYASFSDPTNNDELNNNDFPSWLNVSSLYPSDQISIACSQNLTGSFRYFDFLIVFKDGTNTIDEFYISVFQNTVSTDYMWYQDTDGDGKGDFFVQGISHTSNISPPSGYPNYVNNNDDYCPEDPHSTSNGCEVGYIHDDLNWITSKSYNINGALKASSKAYYNDLGKGIQSQSLDIKTGRSWASQTMYDAQGRPALTTLSAPVRESGSFEYEPDFVENSSNNTYTKSDFESTPESPTPIGNVTANTLGRYYSNLNDDTYEDGNSYQDVTDYPFSRTIYSELNPGAVLKTIGGNKQDGEWKQGYTFSMPAGDELTQSVAFGDPSYQVSDTRKIIKTVSRDVHGNEAVMFTDTDGKTLAAARVGAATSRNTTINISEQGFVDIHVPDGTTGFTIQGVSGITTEVYNLITELPTTASTSGLSAGFYRISITNLENYNPETNPVTITCKENYYDYSLNEYDEAGRLIASYQPVGNTKAEKPVSTFEYNALGQLTHTSSPDEGEASFLYRNDGQIRFSQNSKQALVNEFSYTNYDDLGRPIESGVATGNFSNLDADTSTVTTSILSEKQETVYDALVDANSNNKPDDLELALGSTLINNYLPRFLAGNVTKTHNVNTTTWYSYDIYGRVEWIVQDINGLGVKTIDYEYDPITSQVTKVDFQKNVASERFIHRYTYDTIDNSLVKVETSTNGSTYTTHAEYEYYETGALKKVELAKVGGTALQTIDYVYNLNGQLKAINPGGDANDLFSMQIDYHGDDYLRSVSGISTPNYGEDQFNGNIKGVRWNNKEIENGNANVFKTYSYYYNKNNWFENAIYGDYTDTGGNGSKINIFNDAIHENVTKNFNASNSITLLPGFHAKPNTGNEVTAKIVTGSLSTFQSGEYNVFDITYDANGNIRTLNRNKDGSGNNAMDYLNYTYKPDKPNQLLRVDDAAGEVLVGKDIGDQDGDNYEYNSIGQLIKNNTEGIEYVYNASGLVTEIKKDLLPLVKFFYNDKGHRVKKEIYTGSSLTRTDYYVRDAAGTALAIYEGTTVKEHAIYGASRLGIYKRSDNSSLYQLTDHLGNVRAITGRTSANTPIAMVSSTDYYPFGMAMPGRDNGPNSYRYKYQGQEKDPETGKEAFQLRLWDSRIGRWLSPDPYGQFASPYLGMGNNPISQIDPDGGYSCFQDGKRIPCREGFEGFEGENSRFDAEFDSMGNFMMSYEKIPLIELNGPVFKQENRSLKEIKAHTSNVEAHNRNLEFTKQRYANYRNLGNPYTAYNIMEGVAYGALDLTIGAGLEKIYSLAKNYKVAQSFFKGTKYSPKVLEQMKQGVGEFHSFPESVLAFENEGVISLIRSSDDLGNIVYKQQLKIHGSYRSSKGTLYEGYFHFIKESDGVTINHRYFVKY